MKTIFMKTFVVITMVMSSFCAHAQVSKGMKLLRGEVGFSTSSYHSEDTMRTGKSDRTSLSIGPSFGYFISDRVCIGLTVPFSYSLQKSFTEDFGLAYGTTNRNFYYGVQPFVRYYIPFSEKFYGYLNGGVALNLTKGKSMGYTGGVIDENRGYSVSPSVNFGLTYFVSPKLAIETSLAGFNYTFLHSERTNVSYDNSAKTSALSFNYLGSGLNLGVSYYFK